MFVDQAKIFIQSGNGGAGCISFRREKYIPRGGPDGGDGGDGGDVRVIAKRGPTTLSEQRYKKRYLAKDGAAGSGAQMSGRAGTTLEVEVPVGTLILDDETGEILADLVEDGETYLAAEGGKGGLGNQHFASSTRQAPRYAQPGLPGSSGTLRLELKLLADVGLVGLPNAGKSTLISRISAARPKVADYPFTTLIPNLGVVNWGDFQSYVVADIPGLIQGACEGKGLGTQFLRHVERSRYLLFMADVTGMTAETPEQALDILWTELATHDPELVKRPYCVAATKTDAADPDALQSARDWAKNRDVPFFTISAVTGDGLDTLVHHLGDVVETQRQGPPGPIKHAPRLEENAPKPQQHGDDYDAIWGEDP